MKNKGMKPHIPEEIEIDEHKGTKPHKHPHEDEEIGEKKVPKMKFKLKQFKQMKQKKVSSKKSKGDDGGFAF